MAIADLRLIYFETHKDVRRKVLCIKVNDCQSHWASTLGILANDRCRKSPWNVATSKFRGTKSMNIQTENTGIIRLEIPSTVTALEFVNARLQIHEALYLFI